jgi:YebC/PmpR family DNA-binding regulatory protein
MAGHSKWANIKHKKAKEDAKRNKIFNRHVREITVAARQGGGDPDANPRLNMAIQNAKSDNLPKDKIERAIKKGTGELKDGSGNYEEITYEGYGPGGIAYMIEATTENKNRTVGDMRYLFGKYGGKLGQNGSVDYLFEQKGIIKIPAEGYDSEELMLTAIDAGAEDVEQVDDYFEVKATREDLVDVRQNLENEGYKVESAELQRIPMAEVKVDQDTALSNFKLMDELDDNDDVSNLFTNMQMDDETLAMAENI